MSSSPEVVTYSDMEAIPGQQKAVADKSYSEQDQNVPPQYYYNSPDGSKERTICGLRTTTFFLTVALILVILAAGIGGGVGGTMAVNNAKRFVFHCEKQISTK